MNSSAQQSTVSVGAWLRQRTVLFTAAGILLGVLFPLLASIVKVLDWPLPLTPLNVLAMQAADPLMWIIDTAPLFLGVLAGIAGRREDLHLQANRLLREREAELNAIRQNLEESVAERARQLDQRNAQMRSVVTFARQVADIQDLPALLSTAVRMISERFERADVDLYVLDEHRQSAVLKASSSAGGNDLLQKGHRVVVGDPSPVGRVARRGTLLITAAQQAEPAEGATRGEATDIALPLTVRGRVIGVLDVHSKLSQSGSQSDAEVLQLLADQLAASIENARLVTESRAAIQQFEMVTADSTRKAWQQYLGKNAISYQLTASGVRPATTFSANGNAGGLKLPIRLRGQEIGSISMKRSSDAPWSAPERDLMEKLAVQVALAVENARLLEETRERAAQEQTIGEVSARFSRSLDVEALLQQAVRELAALPEVAEAAVVLKPARDADQQTTN